MAAAARLVESRQRLLESGELGPGVSTHQLPEVRLSVVSRGAVDAGADVRLVGLFRTYLTRNGIPSPGWAAQAAGIRGQIEAFAKGRLLTLGDIEAENPTSSETCWAESLPPEIIHFRGSGMAVKAILENLAKHTRFFDETVSEGDSSRRLALFLSLIESEDFIVEFDENRGYQWDDDCGIKLCIFAAGGQEILAEIFLEQFPISRNESGYIHLAEWCATTRGHNRIAELLRADQQACCSQTKRERKWIQLTRKSSDGFTLLAIALAASLFANGLCFYRQN